MSNSQVLIVGAGPTGLALALSLAKVGITPRIIEKNSKPGEASRAIGVQARTLEFYRQLGIADAVVGSGVRIESIHMRVHGHAAAEIKIKDFGEGLSPYPFVLSYPQDEHEKLLVETIKALGVEVEWETELARLEDTGSDVRVTLVRNRDAPEECRVAYLCGCDGARSTVRQGLRLDFAGGTYHKSFFVADVAASGEAAAGHALTFCLGDRDFMLVLPVRTTGMSRLIGVIPDEPGRGEKVTFDDLRAYVEGEAGIKVESVNWFSTYRVHHRVSEHFRVGRVFIAGDAGHIHSPAGAQGMNTGIGDSINLAWKLAGTLQRRCDASVLDTYEPERIAFAHSLVATTDKLFQLMSGSGFGNQFFRETLFPHLAPLALGFSGLRSAAFKAVSQTRISYHASVLSEGRAGDIEGGDRLPWMPLAGGGDNFDPLRSLDWQIHIYGKASQELRAMAWDTNMALHEIDWEDRMEHAGFERDALYLIRPDGYVALADSAQDMDGLNRYLGKFKINSRPRV